MPCLHLLISGRVQGVWFRESMRQEALKLGATGWVRNLPDGRVEAVACGNEATLNKLLEWSRRGPPIANVSNIDSEEIPEESFSSFDKRS